MCTRSFILHFPCSIIQCTSIIFSSRALTTLFRLPISISLYSLLCYYISPNIGNYELFVLLNIYLQYSSIIMYTYTTRALWRNNIVEKVSCQLYSAIGLDRLGLDARLLSAKLYRLYRYAIFMQQQVFIA